MAQMLAAAYLVVWVFAMGWQSNNLWNAWRRYRATRWRTR
jgi:hypothetical protein